MATRSTTGRAKPLFAPLAVLTALLLLALGVRAPESRAAPTGGPEPALPAAAGAPLEPPTTGGVAAVERALDRLATHRRLLVVAAHPDDEDTSLLTLVSRGMGGEAAYLSLTRGEGGQNLIGPELGVGLGLLRSGELLAAREIDGAHQLFSRAYDFGYSKTVEETFTLWPEDELLSDVVRAIRRFRPQVVVSVFPEEPIRTHGQHQAAGVVAHRAFRLAGDPEAFPELAAEGLAPHTPQALYRSTWFAPESTTQELPVGEVDPLTGHTLFQLAMASRSQHRSQDMGTLQPLGPQRARLGWAEGEPGVGGPEASHPFAGIDTGLPALAAPLGGTRLGRGVAAELAVAEAAVDEARERLRPHDPSGAVPGLAFALGRLREARRLLDGGGDGGGQEARGAADAPPAPLRAAVAGLVDEKLAVASRGLAAAAGLAFEAVAAGELLVPGEETTVTVQVANGGPEPVELTGFRLLLPEGWSAEPAPPEEEGGRFRIEPTTTTAGPIAPGGLFEARFAVRVPEDASPTVPYFLERPLDGWLYDWSGAPPEARGEPFAAPLLRARFDLEVAGVPVALGREVVRRDRDQAVGEVRRPLRVVPAVEVAATPSLLVLPLADEAARTVEVELTSHAAGPVEGRLEIDVPPGWPAVEPRPFRLPRAGASERVRLELVPPADLAAGRHELAVAAVASEGRRFAAAYPVVDYPHVRPVARPAPAQLAVEAVDLELPPLERVGYVRGASDRVPELLAAVGVPIELLAPEEVGAGTLERFDAVVVGSRAYETEPALAAANEALLAWVRRGGLLVVQYQQYAFVRGGFAPLPLDISRPHDRVTDETAPVEVLAPGHPVFTRPNPIGPADWEGWVQERGLYFAGTWDDAYRPLLASADPGEEPARGALLAARIGEGTYVYTGLSFFRQLPAGVGGAYRLFVNLLGLAVDGEADDDRRRPEASP